MIIYLVHTSPRPCPACQSYSLSTPLILFYGRHLQMMLFMRARLLARAPHCFVIIISEIMRTNDVVLCLSKNTDGYAPII